MISYASAVAASDCNKYDKFGRLVKNGILKMMMCVSHIWLNLATKLMYNFPQQFHLAETIILYIETVEDASRIHIVT